ncbi:hypothetical protein ACFYKX_17660 [Cytobacillus sp. FJAT-54145]|uniref:Arylamine N-acetyltransferase n=1 Tax=Cytobacillus spartinae TaxID=3299023 RepID=A0ABW6KHV9_9BACI
MRATQEILSVWNGFNKFPMETLTKAWYYPRANGNKQRDITLMKEHYEAYGITGNCFDLALWLLHEFKSNGIHAYPIGHHLNTEKAHVAIIAVNEEGNRYFCDLGDQWLQPILIDSNSENFTEDILSGFFPAADIQVKSHGNHIDISYHRPNGKISRQLFEANEIGMESFLEAAEISQSIIKPKPLLECRIPFKNEIAHWEFYDWKAFLSTTEGIIYEPSIDSIEEWIELLNEKTGYNKQFLFEALEAYKQISQK